MEVKKKDIKKYLLQTKKKYLYKIDILYNNSNIKYTYNKIFCVPAHTHIQTCFYDIYQTITITITKTKSK